MAAAQTARSIRKLGFMVFPWVSVLGNGGVIGGRRHGPRREGGVAAQRSIRAIDCHVRCEGHGAAHDGQLGSIRPRCQFIQRVDREILHQAIVGVAILICRLSRRLRASGGTV